VPATAGQFVCSADKKIRSEVMKRLLLRVLLSMLAFSMIFPVIPGIDFHGNVLAALALSVVFGIMLWLVEAVAVAVAAIWTLSTFGLALLWLIPLWVIGFWLLPALALLLTAHFLPQYLTVNGFLPAALAGMVMLLIGVLTSDRNHNRRASA